MTLLTICSYIHVAALLAGTVNLRLNTWASAARGRGPPPRIFIYGTDIVDKG